MFEAKGTSRVELLIKIESILSYKNWDVSDDLLMALLNRFILLYKCPRLKETLSYLRCVNNANLDIISLQSNVGQLAIDRDLLLQKMVYYGPVYTIFLNIINIQLICTTKGILQIIFAINQIAFLHTQNKSTCV